MKFKKFGEVTVLALAALVFQSTEALAADNIAEAEKLYKLGNFQRAGQYLQAAIKEDPDDATAHYLMGNVYSQLKRPADAIIEYQLADDADPVGTAGRYSRQALATLNRQATAAASGARDGRVAKDLSGNTEDTASMKHSVKAISAETAESERNVDDEFNQRIAEINRSADRQVSTLQNEMQERIAANGVARYAALPVRNGNFIRAGAYRTVQTYNPEEENAPIRAEYAPKIQALQTDRQRRIDEANAAHKAKILAIEEQSTKLEQQYLDTKHLGGVKLNPSGTDRFTRLYETGGEATGSPVPVQAAPAKSLSAPSTKPHQSPSASHQSKTSSASSN